MTEEDCRAMWKAENDRLRKALVAAKDELTGILDGKLLRPPGPYMSANNPTLRKIRRILKVTEV